MPRCWSNAFSRQPIPEVHLDEAITLYHTTTPHQDTPAQHTTDTKVGRPLHLSGALFAGGLLRMTEPRWFVLETRSYSGAAIADPEEF